MTMRYHSFLEAYLQMYEGYGDAKYSPDRLQKELPRGFSYGNMRYGKGDHAKRTLQVKDRGEKMDTDIEIGGAHGGRDKYSPAWADGHRKAKKVLDGIDKEVSDIQKSDSNSRPKSDTSDRMKKSMDKESEIKGKKAISDITGVGRKTSRQGGGNKALRRMASMGEAYKEIYGDD